MTDVRSARPRRGGLKLDDQAENEFTERSSRGAVGGMGGHSNAEARGLSDHVQIRLGDHLRAMYDAVLQQPVPDRFRDLIDRLESEKS